MISDQPFGSGVFVIGVANMPGIKGGILRIKTQVTSRMSVSVSSRISSWKMLLALLKMTPPSSTSRVSTQLSWTNALRRDETNI